MHNRFFLILYSRGGILWQDFTVGGDQAARTEDHMEARALAILAVRL